MFEAPLLVLFALSPVAPQSKPTTPEDTGYLYVTHEHVRWPSPESLITDLRSNDDQVRLKALLLVGFPDLETRVKVYSQSSPVPVGEAVVTPDRVELKYAAIGQDATQQAIVAIEADQTQTVFAAVAVPRDQGWERIAVSDCWCQYEMYEGRDALAATVQITPALGPEPRVPERFELVPRASGGETGIDTQNEAHFRIDHGELHRVISFDSRHRSCDPSGPPPHYCEIEKRWFYPTYFGTIPGGTLVESHGRMPSEACNAEWAVRDLEDRFLGPPKCSTYRWNEQAFQYVPIKVADPCGPGVR